MKSPLLALTMLASGFSLAAHATDPAPDNAHASQPWNLRAGTELGQDDSRGSLVTLDYLGTAPVAASFGASGNHTLASDADGGTVTSAGRVYLKYGSETISGGVAFDNTRDQDLRSSQRWTGLLDVGAGDWSAELNAATRHTNFDSFPVTSTTAGRIGVPITFTTTAHCTLTDTGYGLSLAYANGDWSGYVSGAGNSYADTSCRFDIDVPGANRLDRERFNQLSGNFLARAVARAGGQIGQDSRLLQYQYGAGLARHWERVSVALDYTDSKDEFGGAVQDDYTATASWKVTRAFSVDLAMGTTVADSTSAPYAGLYLAYAW